MAYSCLGIIQKRHSGAGDSGGSGGFGDVDPVEILEGCWARPPQPIMKTLNMTGNFDIEIKDRYYNSILRNYQFISSNKKIF